MTRQITRLALTLGAMSLAATFSGCSTFSNLSGQEKPRRGVPSEPAPESAAQQASHEEEVGPHYTIEVQPLEGKYQRIRAPHNGTEFVQDAVDRAKASKRFSNMDIIVFRRDPHSGQSQRMGSRYDENRKRVDMKHDYALHPGDIVVITEQESTLLDKSLSRFLPIGGRR